MGHQREHGRVNVWLRQRVAALDQPPATFQSDNRSLLWSALLAGSIACGVPLIEGVLNGWSAQRLIGFTLLSLVFLLLTQVQCLPFPFARFLRDRLPTYLVLMGLICLVLQSIGGDPIMQPMAFTIPFVYAALHYSALRTAGVAVSYLALIMLGIWLSGLHNIRALLFPVAAYGALMVFMYAFTQLSIQQATARQRADVLAADLAWQRDYLTRLVDINASLTRNLDLFTVLEQVAAAGRTLARSERAMVWLRVNESPTQSPDLTLAIAVPPVAAFPTVSSVVERSLATRQAEASTTTLALPLVFKDVGIGVLELLDRVDAPFSAADVTLLQPFGDAAAVAIENARLYEQAQVSATLAERNRLARELHDTIAQGLTAVTMQLAAAQRSFERDPDRTRVRISRADELAREALEDVRRSVWALASPLVDGTTLVAALEDLTQRFAARAGLDASYAHFGAEPMLDHAAASQVVRIVQEALQNVEKHAHARSVCVESSMSRSELCVRVSDDGCGFVPRARARDDSSNSGFGLMSLRERARLAGGVLNVESTVGVGTHVRVTIPVVPGDHEPATHQPYLAAIHRENL